MSLVRCVGNIFSARGNWNVVSVFAHFQIGSLQSTMTRKRKTPAASSFKDLLVVGSWLCRSKVGSIFEEDSADLAVTGRDIGNPQAHVTWLSNALFAVCRRASL